MGDREIGDALMAAHIPKLLLGAAESRVSRLLGRNPPSRNVS
jgi:hypothetical protein